MMRGFRKQELFKDADPEDQKEEGDDVFGLFPSPGMESTGSLVRLTQLKKQRVYLLCCTATRKRGISTLASDSTKSFLDPSKVTGAVVYRNYGIIPCAPWFSASDCEYSGEKMSRTVLDITFLNSQKIEIFKWKGKIKHLVYKSKIASDV